MRVYCRVSKRLQILGLTSMFAVAFVSAQPIVAEAASVSAGGSHSLLVDSSGDVWSWGLNANGQLGRGNTTPSTVPVPVIGLAGVTAVAAGANHSLALKSDGTVWAWGYNGYGQLGDGTTTLRTSPVQVSSLTGIVAISAGDNHSLALAGDGSAWAWGRNGNSQLGDGTTTQRLAPVGVSGLTGVVAISGGATHSLAVTTSGAVYAWGSNGSGQLGDGTTTQRLSPVPVGGVAAVAVSAGALHSLAVTSAGAVYAWGSNGNGRLGDGTTTQRLAPVLVSGLGDAVAVSAGLSHSLALRNDGGAWGWGYNGNGQLGDGTLTQRLTPVQVVGPALVTTMSTGSASQHGLAVTGDQSVWAWGYNANGQIGDGTTIRRQAPVKIADAGAWRVGVPQFTPAAGTYTTAQMVTLTSATTDAVFYYTTDGTEPTTASTPYTGPFQIATATTVIAKACKAAMADSPTATAAYTMNFGTLAAPAASPAAGTYETEVEVTASAMAGADIRYTTNGSNPVATSPIFPESLRIEVTTTLKLRAFHRDWTASPTTTVVYTIQVAAPTFDLSAGGYPAGQRVVITGSTPDATITYTVSGSDPVATDMAMPSGGSVAVGDYTLKAKAWKAGCVPSAVASAAYTVIGSYSAGAVIAGGNHTLALRPDGLVWAWGLNGSGQLGRGNQTGSTVPVPVAGLTGVTAVAAGSGHSLALKEDGTVWAWGYNGNGNLGDGTTTLRTTAKQVAGLSGIVFIAAGDNYSFALASGGTLWAWGQNGSGQLGDGTNLQRLTPVPVSGLIGVVKVSGGTAHSLAITSTGAVYAWGSNANGRLGDGTTTQRLSPVPVSTLGSGVTEVSAGNAHSLALTSSGAVYAWGSNANGRLGDGTVTQRLTPVLVSGLGTGMTTVSAGATFSVAVRDDNTAWSWGYSGFGQLGDGTTTQRLTPGPVTGLPPAAAISSSAAASHVVARTGDHSVWAWGYNAYGQVGDGTTVMRLLPVPIAEAGFQWKVGTPTFNPAGGTYTNTVSVTVTSATAGATITYTTDGSDPTASSTSYTGPVTLVSTSTLKARAFKDGSPQSNVGSGAYTVTASAPVFTPAGGTYTSPPTVAITTSTTGAAIRYTTDGSEPTASSTLYTGPLSLSTTTTLKARTFTAAGAQSATKSATYTMSFGTLDTPTVNPPEGTYETSVTVTAVSAMPGATLRYTTNGTEPTAASGVLTEPLTFTATSTLKVKAFHPDWEPSLTRTAAYTIQVAAPVFDLPAGSYLPGQRVTVTGSTPEAMIRYTVSGSDPTESDTPIAPGGSLGLADFTLKARAWKDGCAPSAVTSAAYTLSARGVAAGGAHSLVVDTTGGVWSWGDNAHGQLGTADTVSRTVAGPVASLTGVKAASAGMYHSLALMEDGTVWAWGQNDYGQLGDGTNVSRLSPAPVSGLSGIVAVSAGDYHNLAVASDGLVYAWGENLEGQLGDGTLTPRLAPVAVSGLTGVASVAAGADHSLAVTSGGVVYAWGSNLNGRLGDGTTTSRPAPAPVTTLGGVVGVSAGRAHSLAVTSSGAVYAWGSNLNGRLGDGTETERLDPVLVSGLGSGVTAVFAGATFSSAVSEDGTAWIWGDNGDGQLGDGTTAPRLTPIAVSGLAQIVAISSGSAADHNVAVAMDTSVSAWGRNANGRLGDGTTADRLLPVTVADAGFLWKAGTPICDPAGGAYVDSVSVTLMTASTGALLTYTTDGSDPTFSSTAYTEPIVLAGSATLRARAFKAGHADSNAADAVYSITIAPPALTPGGGTYTSPQAVAMTSGAIGGGIRYTTGGGEPTASSPLYTGPVSVSTTTILKAKVFTAAGESLSASATYVMSFGTLDAPTLTPGQGTYATSVEVSAASATPGATLRYTTHGGEPGSGSSIYTAPLTFTATTTLKVKAFHPDWSSSPTTTAVYTIPATPTPTPTPTPSAPAAVPAAGRYATQQEVMVTCAAGGSPRYTLDGTDPLESSPSTLPITISVASTLKVRCFDGGLPLGEILRAEYRITGAIAAGARHTLALKADGSVWAFGENDQGQIGDGTTTSRPVPVAVAGLTNVRAIAAGAGHSLALLADGSLWAWGGNEDGELGDGTNEPRLSAVPVQTSTGMADVVAIAAGDGFSLAQTSTGRLWAWGRNDQGQLGDGTNDRRLLPTRLCGNASEAPRPCDSHGVTSAVTSAAAIAAGGAHALALTSGGQVMAWGGNGQGQLGDGTTLSRNVPGPVTATSGLTDPVRAIAAGTRYSLALRGNGVWSWGANDAGQLGNGTTSQAAQTVPVPVSAPAGFVNFEGIAAGAAHALAATALGDLYAWGENSDGQLGNGGPPGLVPRAVAGVTDVVATGAGARHSVAVLADGTLALWGNGAPAPQPIPDFELAANGAGGDDPDGDGLSTAYEQAIGSDPFDPDTNDDGVDDGASVAMGIHPASTDNDGDGLSNTHETAIGTDPFDPDTDDDGVPDGGDAFPLDPTRSEMPSDPADNTPPTITLLEPTNAVEVQ